MDYQDFYRADVRRPSCLIGGLVGVLRSCGVEIGMRGLFEWMRRNGYIHGPGGMNGNLPTKLSFDLGLMEVKSREIVLKGGRRVVVKTTLITGEGKDYFVEKFLAPAP